MSNTLNWNREQLEVIQSKKERRLTVDAGPGTGKTAVLCARIAYLIEHELVNPNNIWVISFTRTAVVELRNRISTYLIDPKKSYGIKIATIDSHAWNVNIGFQLDLQINKTFERGISDVIKLIKTNEGLIDYLTQLEHLFIDEAQDVVGVRIELILEIIHNIQSNAGVTILSDDAQAIYAFAEKGNDNNPEVIGTLPENIKKYFPSFEYFELNEIYRASDEILKNLFKKGRVIVKRKNGEKNLLNIKKLISSHNHGKAPNAEELINSDFKFNDSSFFLFRTRARALTVSNYLKKSDFRLRMNGMPVVIHSWIAKIFWDWIINDISEEDFYILWNERIKNKTSDEEKKAWKLLVQHFGVSEHRIDVQFMNKRLSSLSPPADFCCPEFGFKGPVIGTIHTSKGREADDIYLYFGDSDIPQYKRKKEEFEDEARILFVGATRAKKHLYVGKSSNDNSKTLKGSGRAYQEYGKKLEYVFFEIGRKDDIYPDGLAGKELFKSAEEVLKSQNIILSLEDGLHRSNCKIESRGSSEEISVYLGDNDEDPLFFLSGHIKWDIKNLLKELYLKRHGHILKNLTILGCRTMAISEESRSKLHAPWSQSGFILVPMITGFPLLAVGM